MGQRVAIIVQHIDKTKHGRVLSNKRIETRVFWSSWGIGRILPSYLMAIANATLSGLHYETWLAGACPSGCVDVTADCIPSELDALDFNTPELVGNLLQSSCNNNGGIFVRVTINKDYDAQIEYAYMLGAEEGGNYMEWCSGEAWMANFPNYIDDKFVKLYNATMEYFGAKERV